MTTARQKSALKTRQNIINAAMEIVGQSGYDSLTSNSLIAKAGIAKGTLYHHFNNLDDVIFAMIRSIVEQMLDSISADEYASLEDYFTAIGDFTMNECANDPAMINIIFGFLPRGMKEEKFKRLAAELIETACARISPVLQQFTHGRLSDTKIDHAVRMIDMFSAGFVIHFNVFDDKIKYQQIWNDFGKMLAHYLDD